MVARFLRFLFATLISVGLAMAPLTGAAAVTGHATSDSGMMQMADMSADMPCCPDEQKQNTCQDCPLFAICMAKVLQSGSAAIGLLIDFAKARTLLPRDEPAIAGLTRPPPDQPPRTTV